MGKVKCNECEWAGTESELTLAVETVRSDKTTYEKHNGNNYNEADKNTDIIKGCPNCLTDYFLMDIE